MQNLETLLEISEAYDAAMCASNEAGYAGITAAETIRYLLERAEAAEAKLAELEKQPPVALVMLSGSIVDLPEGADLSPGTELFTRPAPAINLAELVPDGWKLVPIEPTDEMCDIGHVGVDVLTGVTDDDEYYSIDGPHAAKVYRAMLAAAPAQN